MRRRFASSRKPLLLVTTRIEGKKQVLLCPIERSSISQPMGHSKFWVLMILFLFPPLNSNLRGSMPMPLQLPMNRNPGSSQISPSSTLSTHASLHAPIFQLLNTSSSVAPPNSTQSIHSPSSPSSAFQFHPLFAPNSQHFTQTMGTNGQISCFIPCSITNPVHIPMSLHQRPINQLYTPQIPHHLTPNQFTPGPEYYYAGWNHQQPRSILR